MKKLITLFSALTLSFSSMANIVVIGNVAGVDSLSKVEVSKLFMGKTTKLSNGGKARIIELADGTEERIIFHELTTGRTESQLKASWSRLVFTGKAEAPTKVADFSSVISEVKKNVSAIGYIDESAITEDIKVLLKL